MRRLHCCRFVILVASLFCCALESSAEERKSDIDIILGSFPGYHLLTLTEPYGVNPKPATGGGSVDEPQGATVSCYALAVPYTTIESGDFSPDSRSLAVGSSDVSVRGSDAEHYSQISIWDLKTREWTTQKSGDQKTFRFYIKNGRHVEPRFLNYTFDGKKLIVFQGGAIRILDADSLIEQSHIDLELPLLYPDGHERTTVWDMKVSPAENKVALLIGGVPTDTSGVLRVYDLVTKRMTFEWKSEDTLNSATISFSPDGKKIALAAHERFGYTQGKGNPDVVVLDLDSASVKLWLDTGGDTTIQTAFPSNDQLATVPLWNVWHMNRGAIKFWDINTGKMTRSISDVPSGIHAQVEISRDGKTLFGYTGKQKNVYHAMATVNQRFRLWELPSGMVLADSPDLVPLSAVSDPPEFRFSPDGKTVFAFWLASGQEAHTGMYVAQVCEVGLPGAHANLPNPSKTK